MIHLLRPQHGSQRCHTAPSPALPHLVVDMRQRRRGKVLRQHRHLLREQAVVLQQQTDDALLRHGAAHVGVTHASFDGLAIADGIHLPALLLLLSLGIAALPSALHLHAHGLRRQAGGLRRAGGIDLPLHRVAQSGQRLRDLGGIGDAILVFLQVVFVRHLRQGELHAVGAAAEQLFKGVAPLILDEVVRVLLDVLTVHQPLGQPQHLHLELRVLQQLQRPVGGHLTGLVVVVAQHQLLGKPAEEMDLLLCQRRAHAGHRVVKARLMQRHHVQIALAQDDVGALGLFGQIQAVEHPALAVGGRVGGVHVFRLGVVDDPAAEAHHVAPHIDDRQHQPVAELVVDPSSPARHRQSRGHQLLFGEALFAHGAQQRVPLIQRRAHAEPHRHAPAYLPLVQIGLHRRALGLLQLVVEPPRRRAVQLQHPSAQTVAVVLHFPLLRQGHTGTSGQKLHRLRKGEVLDLHDEVEHAAALFAAEAVVHLLVRRHGKGGRFLAVEGAQAEIVVTLALQLHIARHHVHNVTARRQLIQKRFAEPHEAPPFPRRAPAGRFSYNILYQKTC